MKGAALIVCALILDGIQAAFSVAMLVISAFPGTVFGAAFGCIAGKSVLGDLGCTVGGFILGIIGSIPLVNAALDVVTVPVGVILGFVFSICISCTLGAGFIALLAFSGMFYPKYILPGGITEILPGFDLIPAWTTIAILSILEKSKEQGGALGTVAGVVTTASSLPVGGKK